MKTVEMDEEEQAMSLYVTPNISDSAVGLKVSKYTWRGKNIPKQYPTFKAQTPYHRARAPQFGSGL